MGGKLLASLAMIKTNWDRLGRDYIENFIPLVAECLRASDVEVVSLAALQESLRCEFGLDLPQNVIQTILNRARKRGLVRSEHHVLYREPAALAALDFKTVRDDLLQKYEGIVEKFVHYVQRHHGFQCQSSEAETWLHQYFEDNGLLILRAIATGGELPSPGHRSSRPTYFAGTFIRHMAENEEGTFAFFEQVVQGDMLANAVFLQEPSAASRKFRKTSLYLDAPFLLYSLGYTGEARRAPCKELLDLLYESGADLKCFRHTVDEATGILRACATRLANHDLKHAYGPSIDYFLEQGYSASDVEMFCVRLERDLQNLRVAVVDKPDYSEHENVIDEALLIKELEGEIHYRSKQALLRDVDSVAAIMRIRRGKEYFVVEDCRAAFVTPNSGLARVAKRFFYDDATPGSIPPCLTDHALTILLWLKAPSRRPDLHRKRLIADYYAATQPDDMYWRHFLGEIDKLEQSGELTADEYYLLRHSLRVKDLLMELTVGEPSAFTTGTVKEILGVVRGRVEEDARNKEREERDLRHQAESQVRALEESRAAVLSHVSLRAQRYARYCALAIEYIVLVAFSVGAAYSFPWGLPDPKKAIGPYVLPAIEVMLLVMTMLNLWLGTTVKGLRRNLELKLAVWFERKLRALVDPNAEASRGAG